MTSVYLSGTGRVDINWPTARIPELANITLEYYNSREMMVSGDFYVDYWRNGYVKYFGNFSQRADGGLQGNLTGFDLATYDGYIGLGLRDINESLDSVVASGSSEQAARAWESSLFGGDNRLIGSRDGGSVSAWLGGGSDYLELHSGLFNDVNTNWGQDTINLYGGSGRVMAGKDDDIISIVGGQWDNVNGNMGNDVITNYSAFAGTVRGGKDNDLLINAGGGYFYGNLGADTFKPYAIDSNGSPINGMMFVMDFQIGVDSLDLSALGGYNIIYSDGDSLIGSSHTGKLVAVVEGVAV